MSAKAKKEKPKPRYTALVVNGVEGPSLYINDYRVAGPKPWGGGTILHEFHFGESDLVGAELAPLEQKKAAK